MHRPRKNALARRDLFAINKTDLDAHVGADLQVIEFIETRGMLKAT